MIFDNTHSKKGGGVLIGCGFARYFLSPLTRVRLDGGVLCALSMLMFCVAITASRAAQSAQEDITALESQRAQYNSETPKTIIELQQFREIESAVTQGANARQGTATLVNLDPSINAWFLLTLDWGGPAGRVSYHIENADSEHQQLRLMGSGRQGLTITKDGRTVDCELWSDPTTALEAARALSLPYAPLCNGLLYLRNQIPGNRTGLERVTGFLRDYVWQGEAIVGFVRENFYQDAFRESGTTMNAADAVASGMPRVGVPLPARVSAAHADKAIVPNDFGIDIEGPASRQLGLGRWYPVRNVQGVYVSVMQPQAVSGEIVNRAGSAVNRLDAIEASALDYLVAFDLSQFDLRFTLGTDHPRVGWSPRVSAAMRNDALPGPDGIGNTMPLVTTGTVSPAFLGRVAAVFTAGFKREHGAFKYGALATKNAGSHYGFIEEGVVFSKLQPDLATLYVLDDDTVHMKTWSEHDNSLLARIKFARQNGVALVERNQATGSVGPGALVAQWGAGNWSGSADAKLRTLRAGACVLTNDNKSFLIYGYFSTATPSAMALVFESYGCEYAMLLDINALEHTYLALYARRGANVEVEHLIPGMAEVDKTVGGNLVPRFIGFPDNRDFFYLVRRENTQ